MLNRTLKLLVGACALLVFAGVAIGAAAEKEKADGVAKTNVLDQVKAFTINNIFNYYGNNGVGSYNVYTGNGGLEFPKGSVKTAIYEDGVVWGGFHMSRANPKVGGSVYRHALQAGRILTPGTTVAAGVYSPNCTSDDPLKAIYRVFRVRPDVRPGVAFSTVEAVLNEEAALISRDQATTAQDLYNSYLLDWNEWPGKGSTTDPLGLAPFTDMNGNGTYQPGVDIPGISGADQTLYYVANDNNLSITTNLAGCPPIGVEVHRTFWGYNRSDYLGNMIFSSTIVINKSGYNLDSAFFVQWSDPDLGDSGDDYAGCDIGRSLGFVYNGKPYDATYGTAVPSAGYDFFQGPIVPGAPTDRAVFQLKYRDGYKNLGMSAFVFFTQGNALYADPVQGSGGDVQWYRLMNGLVASNGQQFVDPTTGLPSKFTLSGDPVAGTGWLDGTGGLTPQDRRMCLVTGPFTLANADTQELVVATMVGLGGDRISSIAVLKWYSDLAQSVYDALFNIASPPPAPVVTALPLDAKVLLDWSEPVKAKEIENFSSVGYAFEGYTVYQMSGSNFDRTTATRLATYDIVNSITTVFDDVYDAATGYVLKKPVHFGTDSGLKRTFEVTTDAIQARPLYNGTPYYFAVTAYSVNNTGKPTQLESSPRVVTVLPQEPVPGLRYNTTSGTAITATHTTGFGDATVDVAVANPAAVVGHDYEIQVYLTGDSTNIEGNMFPNKAWRLVDRTANSTVYPVTGGAGTTFTSDNASPVVHGVQIGVVGSPFWTAGGELGSQTFTAGIHFAGVNWGGSFFSGGLDVANNFRGGTLNPWEVNQTIEVRFDSTVRQNAYMFMRNTGTATAPYTGFYSQPFTVWDVTNASAPRQIDFIFMEQLGNVEQNNVWMPGVSNASREYFYFVNDTYTATAKSKYVVGTQEGALVPTLPILWAGWYTRTASPGYNQGDVWRIKTTSLLQTADTWRFSTAGLQPTTSTELAATDVEKINVYPNPYIGFNNLEANKYERFVRFTHLPPNATIRVFNLAGVLVRSMQKTGTSQFYDWDLRNESGFPAGAGMYVIHIDMPDLGKTKILKLGLIPEQQFIDRW